jgi:hypothetical protein
MRSRHVLLALTLASLVVSCAPVGRFRTGTNAYHVEIDDSVVDPYGIVQPARCADTILFTGDVDTACSAHPMTWSYEQTVLLDCTYRDSAGATRFYTDYFLFVDGYIREPSCDGGYLYLSEPDARDPHEPSVLPRDEAGHVRIGPAIRLAPDDQNTMPIPR